MTRLDAIKARAAAATPGPWRAEYGIVWAGDSSIGEMDDDGDAPLVAHARTDIPDLLAVAEAVEMADARAPSVLVVEYPSEFVTMPVKDWALIRAALAPLLEPDAP